MPYKTPDEFSQHGFEGEVRRHYSTRADVQELLKPLSDKLNEHLGYHEGHRFTLALLVPLICVLVTATAILIAAFV
ncbi:MAG: hypothetical protein OXF41_02555 [bacterium]|nr:hypothetical protein [bacterium]